MTSYTYEFATEIKEVEISEEWMEILADLDRKTYNNDHAESRRHTSYSEGDDGEWLATEDDETDLIDKVEAGKILVKAKTILTEVQFKVFFAIAVQGHTFSSYARERGISKQSVREYYYQARRKLLK